MDGAFKRLRYESALPFGQGKYCSRRPQQIVYGQPFSWEEGKKEIVKDIHRLANLEVRLLGSKYGGVIVHELAKSSLYAEVKEKQVEDPILMQINKDVGQ